MSLLSPVKMCSINGLAQAAGRNHRDYLGAPGCLARKPTGSSDVKMVTSIHASHPSLQPIIQPSFHSPFHLFIFPLSHSAIHSCSPPNYPFIHSSFLFLSSSFAIFPFKLRSFSLSIHPAIHPFIHPSFILTSYCSIPTLLSFHSAVPPSSHPFSFSISIYPYVLFPYFHPFVYPIIPCLILQVSGPPVSISTFIIDVFTNTSWI